MTSYRRCRSVVSRGGGMFFQEFSTDRVRKCLYTWRKQISKSEKAIHLCCTTFFPCATCETTASYQGSCDDAKISKGEKVEGYARSAYHLSRLPFSHAKMFQCGWVDAVRRRHLPSCVHTAVNAHRARRAEAGIEFLSRA